KVDQAWSSDTRSRMFGFDELVVSRRCPRGCPAAVPGDAVGTAMPAASTTAASARTSIRLRTPMDDLSLPSGSIIESPPSESPVPPEELSTGASGRTMHQPDGVAGPHPVPGEEPPVGLDGPDVGPSRGVQTAGFRTARRHVEDRHDPAAGLPVGDVQRD